MKKIIAFVIITIVALICTFTFVACSNTDDPTSSTQATLVMNKRYIHEEYVRSETKSQLSYIFHADGTGEYTYHDDYLGNYLEEHNHYIIHFKYTYVDADKSAVVCFYDSIERLDGDDGKYTSTTWSVLLTVSKNVLATSASIFWINEDYLKTLSHFGIDV